MMHAITMPTVETPSIETALPGDRAAFAAATEPHRQRLHLHCYRMLGSVDDADDVVQETLLRAWQARASFEGRSQVGTWLYRIATNACLDVVRRRRRVMPPDVGPAASDPRAIAEPVTEILWLQPYPDRLLETAAPTSDEPEAQVVSRETIELTFIAAIQHLPPLQRAALVFRDVLGWSAKETAELLATTVPAANSALQRARATMRARLPERRLDWERISEPVDAEAELVRRYVEATERLDMAVFGQLLADDVRQTMPPIPTWWDGKASVLAVNSMFVEEMPLGSIRGVPTRVNRQPAVAFYIREAGDDALRLRALDVLTIRDRRIVQIDVFDAQRSPGLGLPPTFDEIGG
jgi:RNA polymerase sigma-70 factor (ECF subfamily)